MLKLNKYNYNYASRLLHKFILNSNLLLNFFFEIEKKFFLKKKIKFKSLFITGLARSGSTILLDSLYKTGFFGSLKYSNLPFLTSPNLWSKLNFFSKKKNFKTERAHKDGIFIDNNSPEAFEEIFWKSQLNYLQKNNLFIEKKNINNIIKNLKIFINLILIKEKKFFYLSKNNNNLIRINLLNKKINNKKILIVFRNPIDHAISLFEQHKRFLKIQKNNKFVLEYMNMLYHNEFGKGHYPLLKNFKSKFLPNKLDYWIDYWISIYSYAQQNVYSDKYNDIFFLSYETLVSKPDLVLKKILNLFNLNLNSFNHDIIKNKTKKKKYNLKNINKMLELKAIGLYEQMKKEEIKI